MDATNNSVLLPTSAVSPAASKVESGQRNPVLFHILPCCKKGSSESTTIYGITFLWENVFRKLFYETGSKDGGAEPLE